GKAAFQTAGVADANFFGIGPPHGKAGVKLLGIVTFNGKDVLGNVNQTTGQVTSIGSLQGDVNQSLAGTAGTGEVFQRVQTLDVARFNRQFDAATTGVLEDAQHADAHFHLRNVTASTGGDGDGHGGFLASHLLGQHFLHAAVDFGPGVNG